MKPEEIVRALRHISTPDITHLCNGCKYRKSNGCDADEVNKDAIRLIERLTVENADLRKETEWKTMVIALAQREQAKAEADRDALLEYAKLFTGCDTCKHSSYCKTDSECNACEQDVKGNCYCKDCERGSNWKWRGLPKAPEEGEKA